MAKMSIAPRTENFSAGFTQAVVSSFPDVSFCYRRPKAGPASVRLELCLRTKQRKITADTCECAVLMNIEERTCIGSLSSGLPGYEVLLRCKNPLPFLIRFNNLIERSYFCLRFSLALSNCRNDHGTAQQSYGSKCRA